MPQRLFHRRLGHRHDILGRQAPHRPDSPDRITETVTVEILTGNGGFGTLCLRADRCGSSGLDIIRQVDLCIGEHNSLLQLGRHANRPEYSWRLWQCNPERDGHRPGLSWRPDLLRQRCYGLSRVGRRLHFHRHRRGHKPFHGICFRGCWFCRLDAPSRIALLPGPLRPEKQYTVLRFFDRRSPCGVSRRPRP